MRHALLLLVLTTAAAGIGAAACRTSADATAGDPTNDTGEAGAPAPADPASPAAPAPAHGNAGTGDNTGLPCDIQTIVESRCIVCHGGTNPPPLLNYEDFQAKSTADPTKTRAQLAADYLTNKTMPPAPAAEPEDDEIKSFTDWAAAGAPLNPDACTDPPGAAPGDAGLPPMVDGGKVDGGAANGCTSGKMYDPATGAGPLMNPGKACNACHSNPQSKQGGKRPPNTRIAGTVFLGPHDPDLCIGAAPPPKITVTVTDNLNRQIVMEVNEAGNFYTTDRFISPIRKVVVSNGTKTREMDNRVTSGDCNSCHTQQGANSAPGRIMAP